MERISLKKEYIIIELAVNIFKDSGRYVADCPALKLSTHGNSIAQVQKHFKEALELWIEVNLNRATLKNALLELGWDLTASPRPKDADFRQVPIELLSQKYYPLRIPSSVLN